MIETRAAKFFSWSVSGWLALGKLAIGLIVLGAGVNYFAPGMLEFTQWVVFVCAAVMLAWHGGQIVPRYVALAALLCGVVGVAYGSGSWPSGGFGTARGDGASVYVMRMSADPTGGASRILRDAIMKGSFTPDGAVRRFERELALDKGATRALAEAFDRAQGESAVVWGSRQYVRYSPLPKPALKLARVAVGSNPVLSARLSKLSLVSDVAAIGLSFDPVQATGAFIGTLTAAAGTNTGSEEREVLWEIAARMNERWRSAEHKAYPFFLLGNHLVRRYLEQGGREPGLLACAIRDYQSALGFLKTGGNPQLLAAVRNNVAVARAIVREAQGEELGPVRSDLELAARLAGRFDPFGLGGEAPQIARANIEVLFGRAGANGNGRSKATKKKVATTK